MEKTYRQVPFDYELAKKIQSKEVEGRIKYSEGDGYAYNADIIKFDLIVDKSRAKPNSTLFRTIVAIVDFDNYQGVRVFNTCEYGCNDAGDDTKLFIELPEEQPKYEFKTFDKVLVRNTSVCNNNSWHASYYSNPIIMKDTCYHVTTAGLFYIDGDIIPYEGNKHLLGTTENPE